MKGNIILSCLLVLIIFVTLIGKVGSPECLAAEGRIDAALEWGDGKVYLFKGDKYVRYDIKNDKVDSGYPKLIEETWPGLWTGGIDAAINWGNGKTYFLKGYEYIRFDVKNDAADPGYPMYINEQTWPGVLDLF